MRLLLVRHGHVEGIRPARFRGRAELLLTALGCQEAEVTARRISGQWQPAAFYCSPLGRCVATATLLGAPFDLKPEPSEAFNDLDYGEWTGKTHLEVRAADPVAFERWWSAPDTVEFPGGESLQDLADRTVDGLHGLLVRHPDDTVVVVSHGSVLRVLLLHLLHLPLSAYWGLSMSPCGLTEATIERAGVQIIRVNETAHLELAGLAAPG